jgi:hypothetical protein
MSRIWVIFNFLIIFSIHAGEVKINKMVKQSGMSRSFELKTNLSRKVIMDCQSFIQGIRIGEFQNEQLYLLDPDACEGMHYRIKTSLKRGMKHCVDLVEDIRSDYSCY